MKQVFILFLFSFISLNYTSGQSVNDFEGKIKLGVADQDDTENSLIVRLPDGTLGERDASTVNPFQNISASRFGDTLFLSNGGFLIIPGLSAANPVLQCTEEQLNYNGATGFSNGVGQTFEPCVDGLINIIRVQTNPSSSSGTFVFTLRDSGCNVIWTVPAVSIVPNSIIEIDLTTGSGTSNFVNSGQSYSFHFETTAMVQFRNSSGNPYPQGHMTAGTTCTQAFDPNRDFWFQVEIY